MKVPEQYRVQKGILHTGKAFGNNGLFIIPFEGRTFTVIASDGEGWDHVSVSSSRTPKWKEMCYIKSLFWDDEEVAVQFHPKTSEYINNHPECLHLWKLQSEEIKTPPSILVGIK